MQRSGFCESYLCDICLVVHALERLHNDCAALLVITDGRVGLEGHKPLVSVCVVESATAYIEARPHWQGSYGDGMQPGQSRVRLHSLHLGWICDEDDIDGYPNWVEIDPDGLSCLLCVQQSGHHKAETPQEPANQKDDASGQRRSSIDRKAWCVHDTICRLDATSSWCLLASLWSGLVLCERLQPNAGQSEPAPKKAGGTPAVDIGYTYASCGRYDVFIISPARNFC